MKKKKDGLIKGMIAAAIIFVVGFILTVCFGAYLAAISRSDDMLSCVRI